MLLGVITLPNALLQAQCLYFLYRFFSADEEVEWRTLIQYRLRILTGNIDKASICKNINDCYCFLICNGTWLMPQTNDIWIVGFRFFFRYNWIIYLFIFNIKNFIFFFGLVSHWNSIVIIIIDYHEWNKE